MSIYAWFDEGVAAYRHHVEKQGRADDLARLVAFPDPVYACPICLNLYARTGLAKPNPLLTKEDVPPKKLGGRPILLTCKKCNNGGGSHWDYNAIAHRKMILAMAGAASPLAMVFRIGETEVHGKFSFVDGIPFFEHDPDKNNPATRADAGVEATKAIAADTPFDFQLAPTFRVDLDSAAWSWIRTAYLAVFALAGYGYAVLPEVQSIREVLADPGHVPAPGLVMQVPFGLPGPPQMYRVIAPTQLRGLMLSFGHVHVFLPDWVHPRSIADIEEGVAWARSQTGGPAPTVTCTPLPWPVKALYALDE